MNCDKCGSERTVRKGKTLHQGALKYRYLCKGCEKPFYVVPESPIEVEGWNKAQIATDEAKQGNIPEIGLEENLLGLEVTGVTYLKKDENNILHWVKTKTKKSEAVMLQEFADRLCERIPEAPVIAAPQVTDSELLTQITISDLHIGSYVWAEECGADWDLKIAYDSISKAVDLAISRSPDSEIGLLMELGDFAHYSGHEAVTPTSGNILDADGRFQKMLDVSEDVLIESIEKMLLKYRLVKVFICTGNHDLSVSDTFRSLIKRYYRKNDRLEVIGSANPFYCLQHGRVMIGAHHSHLRKRIILPSHFSQYFPKIWGDTEYRYIHCGHLHSYHAEEKGGCITIQHPTLAAADAYAAHRFDKSLRSINAITYSSKYGMVYQNFVPIELINDQLRGLSC